MEVRGLLVNQKLDYKLQRGGAVRYWENGEKLYLTNGTQVHIRSVSTSSPHRSVYYFERPETRNGPQLETSLMMRADASNRYMNRIRLCYRMAEWLPRYLWASLYASFKYLSICISLAQSMYHPMHHSR